ncbi:odorant receptor 42b [Anopheles funestus]|uniref:odorant receptor 42b n=1 Tax=Anopheles funestus TaxID=62324 RepID=UPI0020C627EA|nr:odorant receptor 42b [Anopheles funestus]
MFTFFGSYVITSSYLLTLTIELRILNDSYAGAPSDPLQLVTFLKDRVVYKESLLQHIGTMKRQMNVSILLELVLIVCLLAINGLRLCTTTSDLSELVLSCSMIMIYLLEFFQYCWQVDEMELLHEEQASAVYSTPWVGAMRQTKALLLITIRMSQVPLRFMCGGMYQLSTELFTAVVQFIYSLVMMLLHFK